MKINFLLLTILTAAFSSCSTSYKTGQTPDDVYYSPARLQMDEVRRDRETRDDNTVYTSSDDREIRSRVRNRRYRRYNDRYNYPNGYYGPTYGNSKFGTPQNTSEPRKTNLGGYTPNSGTDSVTASNPKMGMQNNTGAADGNTTPVRTFGTPPKTSNNNTNVGNFIRKVLSGTNTSNNNSNNSNNSDNNSSSRTFNNSSNNNNSNNNSNNNNSSSNTKSSSTSETKSTSAPVRTFGKQN